MLLIAVVQVIVTTFYMIEVLMALYSFKQRFFKGFATLELILIVFCFAGSIVELLQQIGNSKDTMRHKEFFYRLLKFILTGWKLSELKRNSENQKLYHKYNDEITQKQADDFASDKVNAIIMFLRDNIT